MATGRLERPHPRSISTPRPRLAPLSLQRISMATANWTWSPASAIPSAIPQIGRYSLCPLETVTALSEQFEPSTSLLLRPNRDLLDLMWLSPTLMAMGFPTSLSLTRVALTPHLAL